MRKEGTIDAAWLAKADAENDVEVTELIARLYGVTYSIITVARHVWLSPHRYGPVMYTYGRMLSQSDIDYCCDAIDHAAYIIGGKNNAS